MVDRSSRNPGGRVANLLRLICALALLSLFVPSDAFAGCVFPGTTNAYCDTRGEAEAGATEACITSAPYAKGQRYFAEPDRTYNGGIYEGRIASAQVKDGNYSTCSGGANPNRNWWWLKGATPSECEARQNDPNQAPGPGLYLDADVGPKCVAGCELIPVGDPLEVKQGRVQGQPANFYRFAREYSGATCTNDPEQEDPSEFTEEPDGKECNVSAGVCITPDGDQEYCSFNPDGTPSVCVPAVDYDNDGVDDDDDTQPGDPDNGADDGEGNESDNTSSGGAKCPHQGGSPPTCKGDGIQCNILIQQYLNRCLAEKVAEGKVSGGIACTTSEPLVCTNLSPAECFAKAQAKKTACAAEGLAAEFAGDGSLPDEGPAVDPATAWIDTGSEDGSVELDMGGWLSSRSCPVLPSFVVMGQTISFSSIQSDMCNFFAVGGMLVLLLAAFQAARILGET